MKTMYQTPIALAVAALFVTPLAFANDRGHDRDKEGATLVKKVKVEKDVKFKGTVDIDGYIWVDSSAMSVVDDEQVTMGNTNFFVEDTENGPVLHLSKLHTNSASAADDALQGANGNIGLNIVAGDNNQQANVAALSAADAGFVFGSADAEVFAKQLAMANTIINHGGTNTASLGGNVLQGASGNIGVNIAAGNSNQQKNDLAASVAVSRLAEASVAVKQMNGGNVTVNAPALKPTEITETGVAQIALSGTYWGGGSGGYSGTQGGSYSGTHSGTSSGNSYQMTNLYSDLWSNDPGDSPVHPTNNPGPIGHADFDTATQGAVQNPSRPGVGGFGFDNTGSYSGTQGGSYSGTHSGGLGFVEVGSMVLGGTATYTFTRWVDMPVMTANTASLSGSALQGASGNIGVNIAAGTNNQQYNGLAMAVSQAPRNGGGTPGE